MPALPCPPRPQRASAWSLLQNLWGGGCVCVCVRLCDVEHRGQGEEVRRDTA